ncbi:MAG: hypothetical protein IJA75_00465 [Oscillospiraceae bacterium]|nr:hypothetical protein [Oscillospiraceae bacterium]
MRYSSQIHWSIRALNSSMGGRLAGMVSVAHTSVVAILSRGNPRLLITCSILRLSLP